MWSSPSGFLVDDSGFCQIPDGVDYIPYHEFLDSDICSIAMPDSVRVIGASAFRNCVNLNSIHLSKNLEIIEHSAYERCTSLNHPLRFPDTLRVIESSAFEKCVNIRSITLPNSLEYLGSLAFSDCSRLSRVDISINMQLGIDPFKNTQFEGVING